MDVLILTWTQWLSQTRSIRQWVHFQHWQVRGGEHINVVMNVHEQLQDQSAYKWNRVKLHTDRTKIWLPFIPSFPNFPSLFISIAHYNLLDVKFQERVLTVLFHVVNENAYYKYVMQAFLCLLLGQGHSSKWWVYPDTCVQKVYHRPTKLSIAISKLFPTFH